MPKYYSYAHKHVGPIASLVMGKKSRHAKTLIHRKITAFYACALNKIQQNSK